VTSRHRLRGRRRFAALRTAGSRGSAAGIRAQVAINDREVARVGFALVGLRSAVRRNRLRRRLREAIRPLLGRLAGHDVVLVAHADAADLPFDALCSAVQLSAGRALARAKSAAEASTADNGVMTSDPDPGR
jgi:ribonuclease P protein component